MTAGRARRSGGRTTILCATALAGGFLALESASPASGQAPQSANQPQVYEPAFFARFAPKTAADMVGNIPGFSITSGSDDRGFGQARQNVLINGRRVSGKANDARTALGRITAESVVRIEIVDGATLDIPGLSGQVANVIAKEDALSGTWSWTPEFRENLQPSWYRGSVTANGKAGGWSWSLGLNAFEFHNGHDGPGVITDASGAVEDVRREGFNGAGEEPSLDATVTYETAAGSIANVNLALRSFNFVGREDSFRNPVGGTPQNRFSYIGEDEIGGELGADYEFDLGPGRLKLIGLYRQEEGDDLITVDTWPQGMAPSGQRVLEHSEAGESILRGEYGFGAFGGEAQWAVEGAFNYLDGATSFGVRQPDGTYPLVPLPEGTARVEERRAETNLSWSRKLSDAWSLQSSLGGEYSELSQIGAGGLVREFVRPKGFLALVWNVSDTLDINLKGERRVGQLDFGDFLSSVDIQNNNRSAGNSELVPEQSWIASTEINRKLGPWGAVKLNLEARLIEDVVDVIPIEIPIVPPPPVGQPQTQIISGVGNIGEATAWSAALSGTINFDPIGLKGVQLVFDARYVDSEVDDPLTGVPREISGSDKFQSDANIRWDIPGTDWAVMAGIEEYQSYANYRLDQIGRNWNAPSTNYFFIENKNVYGMKVRLMAVNLNDTSENFKRDVYCNTTCLAGDASPRLRTNPLDFTEERHRTFGPIVRLDVSGTF